MNSVQPGSGATGPHPEVLLAKKEEKEEEKKDHNAEVSAVPFAPTPPAHKSYCSSCSFAIISFIALVAVLFPNTALSPSSTKTTALISTDLSELPSPDFLYEPYFLDNSTALPDNLTAFLESMPSPTFLADHPSYTSSISSPTALELAAPSAPTLAAHGIHIPSPFAPQLAANNAPEAAAPGGNVTARLLRSANPVPTIAVPKVSRNIRMLTWLLPIVSALMLVGLMMPQRPNQNAEVSNLRVPPPWGPHMSSPTFRDWAWTVMVWSIYSDMDPVRKAAALTLQLRGGALMLIRALPPQTLLHGGLVNGVQVEPMTYIMHSLAERYGQLGEEVRLSAIAELFTFSAQNNERIDDLLTRFDILRERAQAEGQMHMSVQALVWLLLKACNITDNQLQQLLGPTQGHFPATADEFAALQLQMRRMGHIVENSPGNIASILRRSPHTASPAYWTDGDSTASPPLAPRATSAFPMHGASAGWSSASWQQPAPWNQPRYGSGTDWQPQSWSAAPSYPAAHAYPTTADEEWSDNGTDTDTESDLEGGELEVALPPTSSPNEVAHHLWWAYSTAKSSWRRFMGKPVRAVRRFLRRGGHTKGGGKGKGYGKPSAQAFLTELPDDSPSGLSATALFKGKQKGTGGNKGFHSSGKGKGRKGNPLGPDGNPMVCRVPGCGSF